MVKSSLFPKITLNASIEHYNRNMSLVPLTPTESAKELKAGNSLPFGQNIGKIGVLTAGTSDIPVAEEAKEAAKLMGCEVLIDYDVGIAGIHRIAKPLKKMLNEDVCCIIVIAGMEGALPSVVASLVDVPVIGVPTSTGYGIKETPLLTMLHSCAPGLAVVNMDNGFGAGIFAGLMAYNIYKRLNISNSNGD